MRGIRRVAVGVAVLAAAAVSSSCGMVDALGDDDAGAQTATVGVLVPQEGWQSADGAGVLAAVRSAVDDAASGISGWTVDVVPIDETDVAGAKAEVTELIDRDGIAIVGGLTTEAIRAVQPLADDADLLFVSPADVDPTHTRGADRGEPIRPYDSYFRTAVPDTTATQVLARYAVSGLDATKVAVVDGGDPTEAQEFSSAVRESGAEVVVAGAVGAGGVAGLVDDMRADGAQVAYVAGASKVAAEVTRQIAKAGLDVDVIGAQAVRDDAFIAGAGEAADGVVTALPSRLDPTAGVAPDGWADELEAEQGAAPGEYGAAAYDAGTAVGTVLGRCLPPASSAAAAREGCTGELVHVDFSGLTGEVSFDEFGDRVGAVAELRVLRGGRWKPLAGE
ncbi:amino acid/amide ABC transporter substrate-binding protein (HAAT family) [Haloactinopolyspora alba]|uniref:Amino acid/amide ABC transporter substrate-binding protein (HAAT family) n=1 Tax=Haloactinopolyspora alba TaxID=648780 RepID=A0A2P8E3T9_9ACTN|nr:ABC transporter substrate-binding protein [Haloactinopolyspora alba]PSL04087.1 amino acid/amide ABC transporter substrate-binding protein (HAAT family) [Haloactinopolyspora alba]